MKTYSLNDKTAYRALVASCKKQREGITVAGITAKTALPIETVRELLPVCADEYQARLRVTESGEILYSFPRGFSSRYRGARAVLGRFFDKVFDVLKIAAMNLFKVWILVMLVGYFVLFVLIALAAVMLSVAAQGQSKNSDRRDSGGGFFFAGHILELIIRVWFYSELVKSVEPRYARAGRARPKRHPLYKAVFSFVFGDGDPNIDIEQRANQAVLQFIQAADGVISLPEYMILTGEQPIEAENSITAFCARYGGSPEATDDGTVVYRFDSLLLNAEGVSRGARTLSTGPLRRLAAFSSNEKKFNVWFSVLNGVNLLFGGYFLFNALSIGAISTVSQAALQTALQKSYLYTIVYHVLEQVLQTPALPVISWGLGMVPLVFSVLFWLIPLVRNARRKCANETLKLANLRQSAYNIVWSSPLNVRAENLTASGAESRPRNLAAAQNKLINELAGYTPVDVTAAEDSTLSYSFNELVREKRALETYRSDTARTAGKLGGVVFEA